MATRVFDPVSPDFEVRISLFGNSMVGKSSFLHRFIENSFLPQEGNNPTIGVDF